MAEYVEFMLNNFLCVCSPPTKPRADHREPDLESYVSRVSSTSSEFAECAASCLHAVEIPGGQRSKLNSFLNRCFLADVCPALFMAVAFVYLSQAPCVVAMRHTYNRVGSSID